MSTLIKDALLDAERTLHEFLSSSRNIRTIEEVVDSLAGCLQNGGKLISCGNGGSMCDAMHFAEELTGRFHQNRRAMPAMAISDPAHLTCVGNDFGFEYVFSRYIEAHGKPGDILLAISTSGNSLNVINAVNAAKNNGMKTVGLLGKGGGKLASLLDFSLVVDHSASERIQEIHIKLIHIFIAGIERKILS